MGDGGAVQVYRIDLGQVIGRSVGVVPADKGLGAVGLLRPGPVAGDGGHPVDDPGLGLVRFHRGSYESPATVTGGLRRPLSPGSRRSS